jgi:hypothetical protein
MRLTGDALYLWNELIAPLIVLALVITVVVVISWHVSRPRPKQPACPQCAARVYHRHSEGS